MGIIRLPSMRLNAYSTSQQTQVLDGTNDSSSLVFLAPKTGTITKIYAYFTAATGTPTISGSIQGVAARAPNGTVLNAGAATVSLTPSAAAWSTFTLGTPADVTAGESYAACVRYVSGATSATVLRGFSNTASLYGNPYGTNENAGVSTSTDTIIPAIAVEYSDGVVIGFPALSTSIATSWTTSGAASTLRRGMKWTPTDAVTIDALFVGFIRPADAFDFAVEVYEGSNTSPVRSVTLEGDVDVSATSAPVWILVPFTALALSAGTAYRFTVRPTTTTAPTGAFRMDFNGANGFNSNVGGSEWSYTTGNEPLTTWTDTANQYVAIIPRITEVASGGGGLIGKNALIG